MSVTQKKYTWNERHGRPDGTKLFLHCATRRRLERDTACLFINQCSDRRFATGGRLSRHSGLRGQAASKPDGFAFGALRAGARSDKRVTMVWRRLLPCVTIMANGVGALRDRCTCHGTTDVVGRHARADGTKPCSPYGAAVWAHNGAMVAASRTGRARENRLFGYKFRLSRGFIAVFAKILPVPATERREKAINLHACLDL